MKKLLSKLNSTILYYTILYYTILVTIVLLIFNVNVYAEQKATIDVHTKIVNPHKISKLLNGGFIELLLDYVNGFGGMWAQEIEDRGFEELRGRADVDYWHWTHWFASNENQGSVDFVEGGYNKNDKYQLRINNASETESGIYQKIYLNDEVSHYFYIYAIGENTNGGIAKIILFDEQNEIRLFEKEIDVTSDDWFKTEFEIPAIPNLYSPNFTITYKGEGAVYFDEVSLMPTNNFYGIRKEWLDFLQEWKPGTIRYPGGCWVDVSEQRWEESIGDIDQRKSVVLNTSITYHDQYTQRYDFGTDEYMKICYELDMEPYLVTNVNRDLTESSINYLEYCNGSVDTYWGKKRADNGHSEPYNVKYWEIGNEQWGDIAVYTNKFNTTNDLMKAIDPTILTIVNGNQWRENDFDTLMTLVGNRADIYGWHHGIWIRNLDSTASQAEKNYLDLVATTSREDNYIAACEQKLQKYPNLKLANTEWWTSAGDAGDDWLFDTANRNTSLKAGMWSAGMYLSFMRNPQVMVLGNRTMGIGLFKRAINSQGKKVIYTTPALPALAMVSNKRGNYIVNNFVECDMYYVHDYPPFWVNETKYLDVATSVTADTLYVSVINRHPRETINTTINLDIDIRSNQGRIYELTSEHYSDYNSPDEPDKIKVVEKDLNIIHTNNSFVYSFPKHSVTVLAIHIDSVNVIPTPNLDNEVVLYPNPVENNSFYLRFGSLKRTKQIDIYNSLGQLVYSKPLNFYSSEIYINNLNLATGAYQLVIETTQGRIYKNFIAQP